jgi:hypothetical protein
MSETECALECLSLCAILLGMNPKRIALSALLLLALAVAGGGCSGINASQSVSPLDFLLPGLRLENGPKVPAIPDGTNSPAVLARAR